MDEPPSLGVFGQATKCVEYLRERIAPELHRPSVGIICGSGLGDLANAVLPGIQAEFDYQDLTYFPWSTVQGHAGKLLFGFFTNNTPPVVLMIGRAHFYEGHSIDHIAFPIRVLKLLGIETLIVTNAAGGLNHDYSVGDVVIISDHLNLAGLAGIHPLRGPNVVEFGVRFPPLSEAYDLDLRRRAHRAWKQMERFQETRKLHEGVYAFVGGPSYETRAECRMLKGLGADLVGMSTVPEVIVARHCGIRVLAISLVTNEAVVEASPWGGDPDLDRLTEDQLNGWYGGFKANHEEVLQAGVSAAMDVQQLVRWVVHGLTTPWIEKR
ncbi:hypothetical protein MMC30_005536 [Trapelia coarctata]|nr:hypothetical protein [Trapelia coarctata]